MNVSILQDNDKGSASSKTNKDLRSKTPRKQVLARDENKCRKCNREDGLEVHHIVAVSDGGSNEMDNLITLCSGCHTEWHAVEKVSKMTMDLWLKYPPVHRIIVILEEIERLNPSIDASFLHTVLNLAKQL